MAHINVRGRLVEEPQRRKPAESELVSFRFRSDEYKKGGEKSDPEYIDRGNFFDVTLWREDLLDSVCMLEKGDRITVEGTLQTHHWTDDKGTQRADLQITADHISPYIKDLEKFHYKPRAGRAAMNEPREKSKSTTGESDERKNK